MPQILNLDNRERVLSEVAALMDAIKANDHDAAHNAQRQLHNLGLAVKVRSRGNDFLGPAGYPIEPTLPRACNPDGTPLELKSSSDMARSLGSFKPSEFEEIAIKRRIPHFLIGGRKVFDPMVVDAVLSKISMETGRSWR